MFAFNEAFEKIMRLLDQRYYLNSGVHRRRHTMPPLTALG